MKNSEKDAKLALLIVDGAVRQVKGAQRCEQFMQHVAAYSPQYYGLAVSAQRKLALARTLLQAARRLHPATTPKSHVRAANLGLYMQLFGRGFRPPKGGMAVAWLPTAEQAKRNLQWFRNGQNFDGFFGE